MDYFFLKFKLEQLLFKCQYEFKENSLNFKLIILFNILLI